MLRDLFVLCKKALLTVTLFSAVVNILMLAVPIYTLQLYDRVLASQSSETLIYLCVIVVVCMVVYALLEFLRAHILIEVSQWLDKKLSPVILMRSPDQLLQGNRYGLEAQRDMAVVKNFLKSPSVFALLDMPWFPIYLIVIFMISVSLGFVALLGTIILFVLAYLNQKISTRDLCEATRRFGKNTQSVDGVLQHAEIMQALGMMPSFVKKWFAVNVNVLAFQSKSAVSVSLISAISKWVRMLIQIFILTVGALLAMQGQLTGGAMIAASIIAGRALAPVEQFISAWKEFFTAKESALRLQQFMQLPETRVTNIALPKARGIIACDNLIYMPAGCAEPILQNIHFQLAAGESLAVIGPSGSGKSTLARLMLGVFQATRGAVRLDGANVYCWDREDFGKQVGYLPQHNELLDGTIKENIARLTTDHQDIDVIQAATIANAHEMILRLPKAYDTRVNEFQLSGGQLKRVALARAFYKSPCFIVLDEPETHLDAEGEIALLQAIQTLQKEKQVTLMIITRQVQLIQLMDSTLVLKDGKMQAMGKTAEILDKMKR